VISLGLDLLRPDETTEEEKEAFRRLHFELVGHRQPGNNFWIDERPDVQKRYRLWSDSLTFATRGSGAPGLSMLVMYGNMGYEEGVRLLVHGNQRSGMTKAQVLDTLAMAFMYLGPLGMATAANALEGYTWIEPPVPMAFPDGWTYDPDAFKSGLDFSSTRLSEDEVNKLEHWYETTLGEIPGYVRFFSRYRPVVLKAYRNRFENTLKVLPKQYWPYFLIDLNVTRCYREGIREGVLLGKGFGMTRDQVVEAIGHGTFYGGMDAASVAYEAAGDILDSWK
jgi:alkylhydroperoxidase/carboxymuconolactone decarboxylase family protein YurZ